MQVRASEKDARKAAFFFRFFAFLFLCKLDSSSIAKSNSPHQINGLTSSSDLFPASNVFKLIAEHDLRTGLSYFCNSQISSLSPCFISSSRLFVLFLFHLLVLPHCHTFWSHLLVSSPCLTSSSHLLISSSHFPISPLRFTHSSHHHLV